MTQTNDAELVIDARTGNRAAFAAIYDRFADQLYSTASSMLSDRDEAADVVQDVFVTASTRLDQLRDPSRLRAWLFAILRNEVYRRSRQRRRAVPTDFTAPGADMAAPDATEEVAEEMAGAELAALVQEAARGLDERDQLVLELSVRQGLQGADLAAALGVSPQQSYGLVHRMRERAERSLTAYCVARAGRRDCPELDGLLRAWDGEFGVLIRKRVARHIERCATCERSKARLAPVPVFGAAPVLAAPIALRDRVLSAVDTTVGPATWSDTTDGATIDRGEPAEGAASTGEPGEGPSPTGSTAGGSHWTRRQVDRHGFPRRADRAGRRRAALTAVAAIVGLVALIAVVLLAWPASDASDASKASEGGAAVATTIDQTVDGPGDNGLDADQSDGAADGGPGAAHTEPDLDGDGAGESGGDGDGDGDGDGAPDLAVPDDDGAADPGTDATLATTATSPPPTAAPVAPTAPATSAPATSAPATTTVPNTSPPTTTTTTPATTTLPTTAPPTTTTPTTTTPPTTTAPTTTTPPTTAPTTTTPATTTPTTTPPTPPTISNVQAPSGNVCLGSVPTQATVLATITGESAVSAVLSWNGPSGQAGQTAMTGSPAAAGFTLTGDPTQATGTWAWLITATDTSGSVATVSGTFTASLC